MDATEDAGRAQRLFEPYRVQDLRIVRLEEYNKCLYHTCTVPNPCDDGFHFKLVYIPPGFPMLLQRHDQPDDFRVLAGKGVLYVGHPEYESIECVSLGPDTACHLEAGLPHSFDPGPDGLFLRKICVATSLELYVDGGWIKYDALAQPDK